MTAQRKVVEEVAGTRWVPSEVRFARGSKRVMADIELGARGCLSCLWVADAALLASMTRAGYSADGDQQGRRLLRSVEEVVQERAMLERAVARPASMLAWPKRRARRLLMHTARRIAPVLLRAMERSDWNWMVSCVGRRGAPTFVDARVWRAYAWCLVLDEGIELGMRLEWRKQPPGPQMRAARRTLAATFGPFGYAAANVRGVFMVEKSVRGLADARTERARLDAFFR